MDSVYYLKVVPLMFQKINVRNVIILYLDHVNYVGMYPLDQVMNVYSIVPLGIVTMTIVLNVFFVLREIFLKM